MSTSYYHTNYSNQKNNKNTGLPRSLRSLVMTGAESFLYPPYFLQTKQQTFAMPGAEAQNKIVPNGFGTLFAQANNMGMQRYTITPTDTTVKEVARKLFGDDNYAYSIALANGVSVDTVLNTGKDIIIPPYIPTGIYSEPYLPPNAMFNYLSQGLQLDDYHFPKPKQKKKRHGFFKRLIVTVVAVVAAVVSMGTLAPALAGIFASMHLFAANVLATMAAAAVANVTTQATAMLLGVQKRFNWRSLAASIATAPIGMNHTFGASTSFSSIVGDIMISTAQNVLSQAIQGQVDIGNVVLTAFTTAAGAQIPHHFQFPRIEMQNAFIAVTSTAFADMIENHGRINPENIAIAMAGVAAAYGANEINKRLEKYLPKKEMVEKQKPEKPVAKRLNPKAPLSQKELQDVKNAQDKLQRPSAKSPPVRSRWQPASGNEMENDVGDIFSAMVDESFKNSDGPRGAPESRNVNDTRIKKISNEPMNLPPPSEEKEFVPIVTKPLLNGNYVHDYLSRGITAFGDGAMNLGKYIAFSFYHPEDIVQRFNAGVGKFRQNPLATTKEWGADAGSVFLDLITLNPEAVGSTLGAGGVLGPVGKVIAPVARPVTRAVGAVVGSVAGKVGEVWSTSAAKETLFGKSGLNAMRGSTEVLERSVASGARLTKGRIQNYLNNIQSIEREAFMEDLRSLGLNLKGEKPEIRGGRGREFLEYTDKRGNTRVKIHPPDKVTSYNHMHLYDKKGNSLNQNLERVNWRSPNAHIKTEFNGFANSSKISTEKSYGNN